MLRKSLAVLLTLTLLLGALISCSTISPEPLPKESAAPAESAAPDTPDTPSEPPVSEPPQEGEPSEPPAPVQEYQTIPLSLYRIVIPQDCDRATYYAGLNLADALSDRFDLTLPLVTDDTEESEHEILIGATNREESTIPLSLWEKEYLIQQNAQKIVLQGRKLYVGAAAAVFATDYLLESQTDGTVRSKKLPTEALKHTYEFPTVYQNVILMIGDGMGYEHVNAAQANGLDFFVATQFSAIGSSTTRSQSVLNGTDGYTDSAAAATALATGYKTLNGYVGKDANGVDRQNVRELAQAYGAKTGIVTTDVITGATPAGFLCHNLSRDNTSALQAEINRLIDEEAVQYCEGSVGDALTTHTRAALRAISDSSAPFFLMVEEGYIDKKSHDNNMADMLAAVKRFDDAIAYVSQFLFYHPDTALIVTADHETGGVTETTGNSYGYRFTVGTHTNADVPLYAMGAGVAGFHEQDTENIDIARFIAKAFGAESFGQTTPVS